MSVLVPMWPAVNDSSASKEDLLRFRSRNCTPISRQRAREVASAALGHGYSAWNRLGGVLCRARGLRRRRYLNGEWDCAGGFIPAQYLIRRCFSPAGSAGRECGRSGVEALPGLAKLLAPTAGQRLGGVLCRARGLRRRRYLNGEWDCAGGFIPAQYLIRRCFSPAGSAGRECGRSGVEALPGLAKLLAPTAGQRILVSPYSARVSRYPDLPALIPALPLAPSCSSSRGRRQASPVIDNALGRIAHRP
nr:hypothetical protein CFP56_50377 [Quercus suber]